MAPSILTHKNELELNFILKNNSSKSDLCIPVPFIEDSDHGDIANYINDAFVNVSSGSISPLDIATLESFLPACSPAPELYPWEVYESYMHS